MIAAICAVWTLGGLLGWVLFFSTPRGEVWILEAGRPGDGWITVLWPFHLWAVMVVVLALATCLHYVR